MMEHADPRPEDTRTFKILETLGHVKPGPGGIVCMYDTLFPLDGEDNRIIPLKYV